MAEGHFKWAGSPLTEGRNTGFKKITDALEANGSPKPEFETDESRHDTSYDEQVRQLIDFCDVPRSRSEMQEYLGITSRGYFAYKYIKPLVEEGKLEMTIPDKPQSRNQKYVRAQS